MRPAPSSTLKLARFAALAAMLALTGCPNNTPGVDASTNPDVTGTDVASDRAPEDAPQFDVVFRDVPQDTADVVTPGPDVQARDVVTPDDVTLPDMAPIFRNPVTLDDATLARQALDVLRTPVAGGETLCGQCHGLTRQTLRHWRALSDVSYSTCFTDLEVRTAGAANTVIDCARGGMTTGSFSPQHLGIFATAAQLDWFRYVFQRGGGDWAPLYDTFVTTGGMPPRGHMSITQPQFDLVAEWFIRGLPGLETVVPEDPRPTTCTPGISADVRAHVTAMATTGWTARNRDMGLLMHGCAGATNPRDCLASEPRARDTTFGAEWENALAGSTQRVLYTTSYRSSYWTRSSADGRFVGHGSAGTPSSRIIDLQTDRTIGVAATYDPGFFPDNSGWVMLGGTAGVCETSVLTTGMPTMINFTEPGCRRNSMIGLYEHLGASLSGTDYMAVHGVFVSDNGGTRATLTDPAASFTGTTQTRFTLMTNTGSGFVQNATISARTPYEGDAVISPSTRLLITRVAGASERQLGYVLRRVDITGTGTSARVAVPEIARYCFNGAKPAISLDERWIVTHHYIGDADAVSLGFTGPTDPAFAQYRTRGAANVYLIDMLTGATTRITNMQPGQYALFPHFRSDGWIYFIVRTPGTTPEHVVASDAALMLAATPTP